MDHEAMQWVWEESRVYMILQSPQVFLRDEGTSTEIGKLCVSAIVSFVEDLIDKEMYLDHDNLYTTHVWIQRLMLQL